jgi:hypothetical protein
MVNFNPTGSEDIRRADVRSALVTKLGSDGSYGGTITTGSKEASVAGFGVHDSGFVVVGTFVGAGDFDPGSVVQSLTVQTTSGFLTRFSH